MVFLTINRIPRNGKNVSKCFFCSMLGSSAPVLKSCCLGSSHQHKHRVDQPRKRQSPPLLIQIGFYFSSHIFLQRTSDLRPLCGCKGTIIIAHTQELLHFFTDCYLIMLLLHFLFGSIFAYMQNFLYLCSLNGNNMRYIYSLWHRRDCRSASERRECYLSG